MNVIEINRNAERIARSDNYHDFSKIFNIDVFQQTSANCLPDSEKILNEDTLLEKLFNLERNEQKQFQYKRGTSSSYQISYNSDFSTFIDNMENNPICVIDMDLGGFSIELVKYLIQNRDKACTIYNGPEVKYDPAGKTNNIRTFVKKSIKKLSNISKKRTSELSAQLQGQITLDNLSRTGLQIEPKTSCDSPFISSSQMFFTTRNANIQEHNNKAYSLIQKKQKNKYFMFDKSFANRTLSVLNKNSFNSFLNKVKEASRRGTLQLLDYLRNQDIIKPSKGSSEHYLAKRLGDAGQAIASEQIHNSILITHDRVLLAFALNIGVPRIVFTHQHKDDDYPITIFERNDIQNEDQQKRNILTNILSTLNVISSKTNNFNFQELIREYNENYAKINSTIQEKNVKIHNLMNSIIEEFSKSPINNNVLKNINDKYQETINEIYQIVPLLKMNIQNEIIPQLIDNVNSFISRLKKNEINIDTISIETLKELYKNAVKINSTIEIKNYMIILNTNPPSSLNRKQLREIQLVKKTNRPRRDIIKKIFNISEKNRIESRLEQQLQLNLLNDFSQNLSNDIETKFIVDNFFNVCIENSQLLEGEDYARQKINIIKSGQVGGDGGDERDEGDEEDEADDRSLDEQINNLYHIEEYIVSFIQSVITILSFDEVKYIVFRRYYNELYTIINHNLYLIGQIYTMNFDTVNVKQIINLAKQFKPLSFEKTVIAESMRRQSPVDRQSEYTERQKRIITNLKNRSRRRYADELKSRSKRKTRKRQRRLSAETPESIANL